MQFYHQTAAKIKQIRKQEKKEGNKTTEAKKHKTG